MDQTESVSAQRNVKPYGFRVVCIEPPVQGETIGGIFLPEEVVAARNGKIAIVVDPGSESGLETGQVVHYSGTAREVGDKLVIGMDQIFAVEDA